MNTLGMIAIVVDEYDLAISHYVNDLDFELIEDKEMTPEKRWVVVSPGKDGARILLAKATNFSETYQGYISRGIEFIESPRQETYGQVVVFQDKYGNKWDLIEKKKDAT
jgi:uncharacterized glyoxalase superfamily protein PhnB